MQDETVETPFNIKTASLEELEKKLAELTATLPTANFDKEFQCPVHLGIMVDPVVVGEGQSYDRASLVQWADYLRHVGETTFTIPLDSTKTFDPEDLTANLSLRNLIEKEYPVAEKIRAIQQQIASLKAPAQTSTNDVVRTSQPSPAVPAPPPQRREVTAYNRNRITSATIPVAYRPYLMSIRMCITTRADEKPLIDSVVNQFVNGGEMQNHAESRTDVFGQKKIVHFDSSDNQCELEIRTHAHQRFQAINRSWVSGNAIIYFAFDKTDRDSFDYALQEKKLVDHRMAERHIHTVILLGITPTEGEIAITAEEAQASAQAQGMDYMECDRADPEAVNGVFMSVARVLYSAGAQHQHRVRGYHRATAAAATKRDSCLIM